MTLWRFGGFVGFCLIIVAITVHMKPSHFVAMMFGVGLVFSVACLIVFLVRGPRKP